MGHMPHLSSNNQLRFDSEPRGELAFWYGLQYYQIPFSVPFPIPFLGLFGTKYNKKT